VIDPARTPPVAFDGDHRAHLTVGARVAILDENGNRLLELDVAPPPSAALPAGPASAPPVPKPRPWTRRWVTWAIPTGVFALGSAGFGIATIASYDRARMITDQSGQYYLSDATANVHRGRIFTWITAGAGGLAIGCAIPTAIYYFQERHDAARFLMSSVGDGRVGVALVGQF
jgi:hypothetical protein